MIWQLRDIVRPGNGVIFGERCFAWQFGAQTRTRGMARWIWNRRTAIRFQRVRAVLPECNNTRLTAEVLKWSECQQARYCGRLGRTDRGPETNTCSKAVSGRVTGVVKTKPNGTKWRRNSHLIAPPFYGAEAVRPQENTP